MSASSSLESDGAVQSDMAHTMYRALGPAQERRLTDYVDEHILQIQRQYKKRKYEDSSLRTLSAYLNAVHPLLTVILMIPPIDNSAPLRTALLLRLTGEILECAPGYPPGSYGSYMELLEILEELDRGWLAVLRSQVWNPESRRGEDLIAMADMDLHSSPINQTDRVRLRSLLILATDRLDEWLEYQAQEEVDADHVPQEPEIRQKFDDIFHLTLGELRGGV